MVGQAVTCSVCKLETRYPLDGERGEVFCCPACQAVSGLLAAEGVAEAGSAPVQAAGEVATLALGGMWCVSCGWLIGETLARARGVSAADVSFVQRQVRVTYQPALTSPRKLAASVRRLGYRAWLPGEKPYDEEEALWTRLMICGVLVVHEMLASFSIYGRDWLGLASAETEWLVGFFNYMGLLATLPVIYLLGWPVLRAGAASLASRRPNIHTLIAIGALAATALSLSNLLRGQGRVYFETTSVLLFLVGIGHWLELRARKSGTEAVDHLFEQIPSVATWLSPEGEQVVPVERLSRGARVLVRPGARFPTDGIVAAGRGDVDESLLTGEPEPVSRTPGQPVLAGSHNLDGAFEVITTAIGAETVAGQIGRLLHGALWQRAPVERLADRLAAWMVPAAVLIASLTFGFWTWRAGVETGLVNALSVLLIACPCALGIATPLTLWVGLGRAARAGVILRSTGALEGLAGVRQAFFDKTGTLTQRPIRLCRLVAHDAGETVCAARVAALERLSEHPLAEAIVAGLAEHAPAPEPLSVADFRALPGLGVAGEVAGELTAVGSTALMADLGFALDPRLAQQAAEWEAQGLAVTYAGWAGQVHAALALGEEIRPEAREALDGLRSLGIGLGVLTGDSPAAGRRWERALGVPVMAGQRPEDKLAQLRAAGAGVLMVGDGINDGPALAAATVGVGLVEGASVAQAAAEVILLNGDLRTIPWLIDLARLSMRKVHQNLAWAFVYNIIGLGLAVSGLLQPAIAALLMVANSALVTANGMRLSKASVGGRYQPILRDYDEDDAPISTAPAPARP